MGFKDFFYGEDDKSKEPVKQIAPPSKAPQTFQPQEQPQQNSFLQQHSQFIPQGNQFVQTPQFQNGGANDMFSAGAAAITAPEQRHIDHVQSILVKTNNGRNDFFAFMKIAKKMSANVKGPSLWTNAFAAYSAVNEDATPEGLLASATEYESALTSDADAAKQRHEGKFSDKSSDIGRLTNLQGSLQTEIQQLEQMLAEKREQLQQTNIDLQAATNKASSSFTSYGMATAAAVNEIQLFKQNISAYLTTQPSQ